MLSLERMNRILEIRREDLTGTVQPGVITGEYQRAVEALGLFYPPDPASLDFCTLGGNVAENAGGPRALKYGVTREYILGLEVVLPSGEVLRTGKHTIKGVAGFDLTALLVGSEGLLGIVTEITTRLIPLPASASRPRSASFPDNQQALRARSPGAGGGSPPAGARAAGRRFDCGQRGGQVSVPIPRRLWRGTACGGGRRFSGGLCAGDPAGR